MSDPSYYRKGFGLKQEIQGELDQDYHSGLVEYFRQNDFRLEAEGLTILLAHEFGFCYGVDRAVEYAYETRRKFPDRRIHIKGEITRHSTFRMLYHFHRSMALYCWKFRSRWSPGILVILLGILTRFLFLVTLNVTRRERRVSG